MVFFLFAQLVLISTIHPNPPNLDNLTKILIIKLGNLRKITMVPLDISKEIKELSRSCVKMKDPDKVESKIKKILEKGPGKLQLIADFDLTVTKQHVDGQKQLSSFCLVNHCKGLPSHFNATDKAICDKYIPIQTDPNLTKAEKIPFMEEFYGETSKLYSGFKFSQNEIKEVADSSLIELRDGTSDLITLMEANSIPLLVFSAGLGNMVTAILESYKVLRPNVHILSNFLQFKNGFVEGFQKDVIHPLNKNGRSASHSPYFEEMASRNNVLLLGDNIGDDEMADGIPNTEVVLKIGFIWNRDDLIPSFLEHFDIVLIDDQTMDLPNSILRACIERNKRT